MGESAGSVSISGEAKIEFRPLLSHIRGMATLSLSDDQVVQLVKQLPPQAKQRVLIDLNAERDAWWQATAQEGEQDMRRLAKARGLNWEAMTETDRATFVDKVLHES